MIKTEQINDSLVMQLLIIYLLANESLQPYFDHHTAAFNINVGCCCYFFLLDIFVFLTWQQCFVQINTQ